MYQISPQVPIMGLVFLLTFSLAVYGSLQYRRRGHQSELLAFVSLMLAVSLWQPAKIFVDIVSSEELMLLGYNFMNGVVVWVTIYSLLWFALAYSDNTRWVNRWTVGFAVATILATSVGFILDPTFMYGVNSVVTQGPVSILGITFNEWVILERDLKLPFYLLQLYSYAIMLIAGGILARYYLRNRGKLYTGQAIALGVGIGTPLVVNFLVFAGVLPPEQNPTDIAFAVSGVAFAIAIFRYRLLRVAPVARKQLVDQMTDPIVMLDDSATVVDCNLAARDLVDAPSAWRGMDANEFFEQFPDFYDRFAGQSVVEAEISHRVNGMTRHYELDISPIVKGSRGASGKLIELRDITDQKEREEDLRKAKSQLTALVEAFPDLAFIKDREGGYIDMFVGSQTESLLKYGSEAYENEMHDREIFDEEEYERVRETIERAIETGEIQTLTYTLDVPEGKRWFEARIVRIDDKIEEEQAVVWVARDITELKEYEQQLETQRDNLKMLNQVVRHDIRNDLQLILANAETVQPFVESEGETYITQIMESTRDAVDITKTARDVTEIMLQSKNDLSPTRVRYIVESEVQDIRASDESALITVEDSIPDVKVFADDMLNSVFRNLLKNAIQHNDKENPEVTISGTVTDETVEIRVADNGPGVPEAEKDVIFEQGEKGFESQGTGLGLYLVDTLVNRYGGDVWIEDNEPEGAIFVVNLPITE